MTPQTPPSYRTIALAILAAAVVVAAATLSYSSLEATVTKTVSTIETTTSTSIVIEPGPNTTSISTTACTYTGPEVVACPSIYNETYAYSISYSGPWGASYQVYNGPGTTGTPVESGSFYGHGPENVTVHFVLYSTGFEVCTSAHKLDASSSTLVLTMHQGGEETNSTSLPFGQATLCLITEQV